MAKRPDKFDFWYAVNNTRIVALPTRHLETFGATILNYYVISELMDAVDRVRVREGRIHAFRPQIMTPSSIREALLEGFGQEAEKYADWLRDHESELRVLQYGFKIRKEEFSEHVLTDSVEAVTDRVQAAVTKRDDPFSAVVQGVDDPWEVCLIRLMVEVIRNSVPGNFREIERRNLFGETGGVSNAALEEVEAAFRVASRNPALIKTLAAILEKHGVFEKYQDRFFALLKSSE